MLYAFWKSVKAKARLANIHVGMFKRLGDDLRKAGTLAGAGLIGMVVPNDTIGFKEGIILFICGVLLWTFGHVCAYIADRVELKQKKDN